MDTVSVQQLLTLFVSEMKKKRYLIALNLLQEKRESTA
jgi:hypothetical protein